MKQNRWLLDSTIVAVARKCSTLVHQEFGKRLPLAHSDFLNQMQEYASVSDSKTLKTATSDLLALTSDTEQVPPEPVEMLTYMGKDYPRFRDGREFSGLYRGAPVYKDKHSHLDP